MNNELPRNNEKFLPHIVRKLGAYAVNIAATATETLHMRSPGANHPIELPPDHVDIEIAALEKKLGVDIPLEGESSDRLQVRRYMYAETTVADTIREYYDSDSPQETLMHQARTVAAGQALALFFDKDQIQPFPVGFNDAFLLVNALDESRGLATETNDSPEAESRQKLYAKTKELIAKPTDDAYDTHHLLRSAFELSERNDTPIMHEHLRLMQGENLIHGIMNDVKLFGKNNAFTLLQDRIGEANQKGFEIPPDDQLKVELQRRLTELYAKA